MRFLRRVFLSRVLFQKANFMNISKISTSYPSPKQIHRAHKIHLLDQKTTAAALAIIFSAFGFNFAYRMYSPSTSAVIQFESLPKKIDTSSAWIAGIGIVILAGLLVGMHRVCNSNLAEQKRPKPDSKPPRENSHPDKRRSHSWPVRRPGHVVTDLRNYLGSPTSQRQETFSRSRSAGDLAVCLEPLFNAAAKNPSLPTSRSQSNLTDEISSASTDESKAERKLFLKTQRWQTQPSNSLPILDSNSPFVPNAIDGTPTDSGTEQFAGII